MGISAGQGKSINLMLCWSQVRIGDFALSKLTLPKYRQSC